jgi:hypothetical protein
VPELSTCRFVITSMNTIGKSTLPLCLIVLLLTLSACASLTPAAPVTSPAAPTLPASSTASPATVISTTAAPTTRSKTYANTAFGLSFSFPADWAGPEEYISEPTLRVEIGSDKVYPYGQPPEQPSTVKNSYNIVIQYTQNNQNTFWKESFDQVTKLKDGESVSGPRSKLIRVRQVGLGRFQGVEFISTLSDTAQTEPVYMREVILVDDQSNLLTISGTPNNVDLGSGRSWRDAFSAIDEQNVVVFHQIVESLIIQ